MASIDTQARPASKLKTFLHLIKFEHSIFALPFAYLGLFLAEDGWPRAQVFLWVTVAMVTVRTSGMALNRLLDESIDAQNPRTRSRIDAIKRLSRPLIWTVAFASLAVFVFSTKQLNPICFYLSPIPIALVWLYPHLKKITWLSHLFLGTILGIAPYGGWLASRGDASWIAGLLTLAVTTWVCGFDMFYALQDIDFDRSHNLKSFPARFGQRATVITVGALHVVTICALASVGVLAGLGIWYWLGWTGVTALIIREHQLVARFGLKRINEAFFNLNAWVSVVIFAAVVVELVIT